MWLIDRVKDVGLYLWDGVKTIGGTVKDVSSYLWEGTKAIGRKIHRCCRTPVDLLSEEHIRTPSGSNTYDDQTYDAICNSLLAPYVGKTDVLRAGKSRDKEKMYIKLLIANYLERDPFIKPHMEEIFIDDLTKTLGTNDGDEAKTNACKAVLGYLYPQSNIPLYDNGKQTEGQFLKKVTEEEGMLNSQIMQTIVRENAEKYKPKVYKTEVTKNVLLPIINEESKEYGGSVSLGNVSRKDSSHTVLSDSKKNNIKYQSRSSPHKSNNSIEINFK